MKKRQFLGAAMAGGLTSALSATAATAATTGKTAAGPALLTVSGAIGKPNRGPLDPVRDQMMFKHKVQFTQARAFDFAALTALPAVTIAPTLEYDASPHTLRGPLLLDVLAAAGARLAAGDQLLLRAVDGYAAAVTVAQVRARRYIVATHLDGATMALGGLGPLWAIYDADRAPDMAGKPLPERFATCPWALYHIEVA
jgi:hypothetical protein